MTMTYGEFAQRALTHLAATQLPGDIKRSILTLWLMEDAEAERKSPRDRVTVALFAKILDSIDDFESILHVDIKSFAGVREPDFDSVDTLMKAFVRRAITTLRGEASLNDTLLGVERFIADKDGIPNGIDIGITPEGMRSHLVKRSKAYEAARLNHVDTQVTNIMDEVLTPYLNGAEPNLTEEEACTKAACVLYVLCCAMLSSAEVASKLAWTLVEEDAYDQSGPLLGKIGPMSRACSGCFYGCIFWLCTIDVVDYENDADLAKIDSGLSPKERKLFDLLFTTPGACRQITESFAVAMKKDTKLLAMDYAGYVLNTMLGIWKTVRAYSAEKPFELEELFSGEHAASMKPGLMRYFVPFLDNPVAVAFNMRKLQFVKAIDPRPLPSAVDPPLSTRFNPSPKYDLPTSEVLRLMREQARLYTGDTNPITIADSLRVFVDTPPGTFQRAPPIEYEEGSPLDEHGGCFIRITPLGDAYDASEQIKLSGPGLALHFGVSELSDDEKKLRLNHTTLLRNQSSAGSAHQAMDGMDDGSYGGAGQESGVLMSWEAIRSGIVEDVEELAPLEQMTEEQVADLTPAQFSERTRDQIARGERKKQRLAENAKAERLALEAEAKKESGDKFAKIRLKHLEESEARMAEIQEDDASSSSSDSSIASVTSKHRGEESDGDDDADLIGVSSTSAAAAARPPPSSSSSSASRAYGGGGGGDEEVMDLVSSDVDDDAGEGDGEEENEDEEMDMARVFLLAAQGIHQESEDDGAAAQAAQTSGNTSSMAGLVTATLGAGTYRNPKPVEVTTSDVVTYADRITSIAALPPVLITVPRFKGYYSKYDSENDNVFEITAVEKGENFTNPALALVEKSYIHYIGEHDLGISFGDDKSSGFTLGEAGMLNDLIKSVLQKRTGKHHEWQPADLIVECWRRYPVNLIHPGSTKAIPTAASLHHLMRKYVLYHEAKNDAYMTAQEALDNESDRLAMETDADREWRETREKEVESKLTKEERNVRDLAELHKEKEELYRQFDDDLLADDLVDEAVPRLLVGEENEVRATIKAIKDSTKLSGVLMTRLAVALLATHTGAAILQKLLSRGTEPHTEEEASASHRLMRIASTPPHLLPLRRIRWTKDCNESYKYGMKVATKRTVFRRGGGEEEDDDDDDDGMSGGVAPSSSSAAAGGKAVGEAVKYDPKQNAKNITPEQLAALEQAPRLKDGTFQIIDNKRVKEVTELMNELRAGLMEEDRVNQRRFQFRGNPPSTVDKDQDFMFSCGTLRMLAYKESVMKDREQATAAVDTEKANKTTKDEEEDSADEEDGAIDDADNEDVIVVTVLTAAQKQLYSRLQRDIPNRDDLRARIGTVLQDMRPVLAQYQEWERIWKRSSYGDDANDAARALDFMEVQGGKKLLAGTKAVITHLTNIREFMLEEDNPPQDPMYELPEGFPEFITTEDTKERQAKWAFVVLARGLLEHRKIGYRTRISRNGVWRAKANPMRRRWIGAPPEFPSEECPE